VLQAIIVFSLWFSGVITAISLRLLYLTYLSGIIEHNWWKCIKKWREKSSQKALKNEAFCGFYTTYKGKTKGNSLAGPLLAKLQRSCNALLGLAGWLPKVRSLSGSLSVELGRSFATWLSRQDRGRLEKLSKSSEKAPKNGAWAVLLLCKQGKMPC
jgi:hypothetical protein